MSISDLLSPLSIGKHYMDINVNSINVGPGTSTFVGPITIQGPATFQDTVVFEGATSVHSPFTILNADDSAMISIVIQNDSPNTISDYRVSGNFFITTDQPTYSINLNPGNNSVNALTCSYVSPGQTSTAIQNIVLPTSGGTPTSLSYYENYAGTYVFSGPWGATTYSSTIKISRIGNLVNLRIDSIKQVASVAESVIIMTGSLPTRFIPASSINSTLTQFPITVYDNNFLISGILQLSSTGLIQIGFMKYTGSSPYFYTGSTGTGICGFDNIFISYIV